MNKLLNSISKKQIINGCLFLLCILFCWLLFTSKVAATDASVSIDFGSTDGSGNMGTLDIMYLLAFMTILPSLVLLCTCFTRIIIVFSLLRSALGTQQAPPNQILTGLALFLTLFIMMPTLDAINTNAYIPYRDGDLTSEEAFNIGAQEMKEFMIKQVDKDSLNLFLQISNTELDVSQYDSFNDALLDLDIMVVAPAFATSELKRAFTMGFLIYVPFIVIDIIVSSVLMSMGMMMLPPATISLPFKLLVFILADGWGLLMSTLVRSFNG